MNRPGLRIAMVGTRGVPARYGGFETAVEEIGTRLVARGHDVVVYGRRARHAELPDGDGEPYLGMRRVTLPAVRRKSLETLSTTALASVHAVTRERPDAVVLFNAANSIYLPAFRARRIPVAVHVDGLEWLRSKWAGAGRRYYRLAESLSVRWADALIADAAGIAEYYCDEFGASTEVIRYGAPERPATGSDRLRQLDLRPDGFHLVVARLEPENHVDVVVEGYRRSTATLPLVVVGDAPYGADHIDRIRNVAATDPRIRLVGSIWDQDVLDELYANAASYLHGHSVGGTNPSLLRAMGAGTAVAVWEVGFNREVAGTEAPGFASPGDMAAVVEKFEADLQCRTALGVSLERRARANYDWGVVTDEYEALLRRLAGGWSRRGEVSGRRRGAEPAAALARGPQERAGNWQGEAT